MSSNHDEDSTGPSILLRNIDRVAVIGAGLSGIVSAVHLLRAGIDVTVFERAGRAGGAWDFDPNPDRDPPYPNSQLPVPTRNDADGSFDGLREVEIVAFAPPGPAYANMKSRGSERVMRTSLLEWPEGVHAPIGHRDVAMHLQKIARKYRVEEKIRFRTRVDAVSKTVADRKWQVRTSNLVTTPTGYSLERGSCDFDAIVVATGRYGEPRVPGIPGLPTWKNAFPGRVSHAKQYRTPEPYCGKTVLIVGGFISALEIADELTKSGAKVYQSARETRFDFRPKLDHEGAEMVAMVSRFTVNADHRGEVDKDSLLLDDDNPIPGAAILQDGRVLMGIQHVIIATGYLTSFPFLGPVLEQPSTAPEDADEQAITTSDGRTVHNLHEDIFYIPDPTLSFIGVTHFASTFSLYDFQAQVLAAVFSCRVRLPPQSAMKEEQRRRKAGVLPGTLLNSVFLLDDFVLHRLLGWVNGDLAREGFEELRGPVEGWWEAFREERTGARKDLRAAQDNYLKLYGVDWAYLDELSSAGRAKGQLGAAKAA